MSAKLKQQINMAEMKLAKLRAKYATWDPLDRKTMDSWQRMIDEVKTQMQFAEHPVMKKWITYCKNAMDAIENILLTDKNLETTERRILMEKRDMYRDAMVIFVPKEKAITAIIGETDANLSTEPRGGARPYPQESTRTRYGVGAS